MAATAEHTPTPAIARRLAPQRRRGMTAGIFGIGAALPDHVITNGDLEQRLDTNDEWIVRRTGIRERRHLQGDETLADLATRACLLALDDAGRTGAEVDHVIVSTFTPDRVTPGLAPEVARVIGAERAAAVDLNAACAGFLYGLDQAAALVESGRASVVLVCGAEALSRVIDHDDRSTAVLFGDGAGAVVVAGGELELGVGGFVLGADGAQADLLYAERDERKLRMQGSDVYRHAVRRMTAATPRGARARRQDRRRHRPLRRPPGQRAHHRDGRGRARHSAREGRASTSTAWPTRRRPRSRSPSSRPSARAACKPGAHRRPGRLRRRLRVGRRAS